MLCLSFNSFIVHYRDNSEIKTRLVSFLSKWFRDGSTWLYFRVVTSPYDVVKERSYACFYLDPYSSWLYIYIFSSWVYITQWHVAERLLYCEHYHCSLALFVEFTDSRQLSLMHHDFPFLYNYACAITNYSSDVQSLHWWLCTASLYPEQWLQC